MLTKIIIDGKEIEAQKGQTILQSVQKAGIYIPHLCSHPDLVNSKQCESVSAVFHGKERYSGAAGQEYEGCKLCLVEIAGRAEPVQSCLI